MRTAPRSQGFVLIVSLIFLAILAIILTGMARNTWLQEAMAGGTREKIRAQNAAQSAARYAEWWLSQPGNATLGASCGTGVISTQVCTNSTSTTSDMPPLSTYTEYSLQANGASGPNTLYRNPGYYIQYMGENMSSLKYIYVITAYGYGGNQYAVAIVQSTFGMSAEAQSLGH